MIARLRILLPFVIAMPKGENLETHEFDRDSNHVRVYPPYRAALDPHDAELRSHVPYLKIAEQLGPMADPPANDIVRLNAVPTYDANVLQIDFINDVFDRSRRTDKSNEENPLVEAGFGIANEFLQTLRAINRASQISYLAPDRAFWELAYLSDEGKPFDIHPDFVRRLVAVTPRWQVTALNSDLWHNVNEIRRNFIPTKWDILLLDADAMLPDVPSAISLANAALEMFSTWFLDNLPSVQELPPAVWEWFTERSDHYQNPSVDDRFGDLLKALTGQSLKEQPELWKAYRDLRKARNNFAHTGRVATSDREPELNRFQARALIVSAGLIVDWCETLLPEQVRRPPRTQGVEIEINKMFSDDPLPPGSSLRLKLG